VSTVLEQRSPLERQRRLTPGFVLALALAALCIPMFVSLARTVWREEDYAHGPIIAAVAICLFWKNGARFTFRQKANPAAFLSLLLGLALYVVGQSQDLPLFSTASLILVVAGALLIAGGTPALRAFAFPLLFLAFLVPLPGFIVEAATGPLKQFVSATVATLLGAMGYPIVREGVVLDMGGHQMLVADACSGMNSIVSLTALTLLYVHLTGPSTKRRWIAMLAAIVPIAIAANVLRVLVLALVAYHFGDEAAQGAVHTLAGLLVFVTAFFMLIALDSLVGGRIAPTKVHAAPASYRFPTNARLTPVFAAAALMFLASIAAPLLKPVHAEGAAPVLESMVPSAFGDWSIDPTIVPVPPTAEAQAKLDRIYSQTVSRTYVNSRGERMMLTVAYGGDQSDALKAHRQEVCYTAQGFTIHDLHSADVAVPGASIPATRMLAVRDDRFEPVTYWFTMGDRVVRGRLQRLATQLREGFAGRVPDGMLVRVSSISTNAKAAYAAQQAFIGELLAAAAPGDRVRLAGAPRG